MLPCNQHVLILGQAQENLYRMRIQPAETPNLQSHSISGGSISLVTAKLRDENGNRQHKMQNLEKHLVLGNPGEAGFLMITASHRFPERDLLFLPSLPFLLLS